MSAEELKLGMWEHWRGGRYQALGLMTHHHTRLPVVRYLDLAKDEENARPLHGWPGDEDGWLNYVNPETGRAVARTHPKAVQRFRFVG